METPKVIIETPSGVADDLYMYRLNTMATLLNYRGDTLPLPLNYIKVTGTIQSGGKERLLLGSEIELNEGNIIDPENISRALGARIKDSIDNEETTAVTQGNITGLTNFVFSGSEYSLFGHVAPMHTGLMWVVNSVCELDSLAEFDDPSRKRVEFALGHHATVLSNLANVLLEENDWALYDGPRFFKFELQDNDDSEVDYPQTTTELTLAEQVESSTNQVPALDQFVGIDHIIEELRDVVRLANVPHKIRQQRGIELDQSILLEGPSGVAKTEIMRALAVELDAEPHEVSFEDLADEHVGKWAKKISSIFEKAYKDTSRRQLLIFDELDGLIRSGNREVTQNVTTVLKKQLETIKQHPHVFFIAATNNRDDIDEVILAEKRIPVKVSISLPNDAERSLILYKYIVADVVSESEEDNPIELLSVFDQVEAINFGELVAQTEGFSGGDIRMIVQRINKRKLLSLSDHSTELGIPTNDELLASIDYMRKRRP